MDSLIALVPSIGVGFLFFLVIRYFVRADRIERESMAELDRAAATNSGTDSDGNDAGPVTSAPTPAPAAAPEPGTARPRHDSPQ